MLMGAAAGQWRAMEANSWAVEGSGGQGRAVEASRWAVERSGGQWTLSS